MLLYIVLVEPGTMTKRFTVPILLSWGISSGQFFVRIDEGGCALIFFTRWPIPTLDLEFLYCKWLFIICSDKIEIYHSKSTGLDSVLTSYKFRCSDIFEPVGKIVLLFQVRTQISSKYNLAWYDNIARAVYVELRGQKQHYVKMLDKNFFKIWYL